MAIVRFFTKSQSKEDYQMFNPALLEQPSDMAQATFVVDDIMKDILSLAAYVCNMPTYYQKGSGKLLKAENISNQITKKLALLKKYLKRISFYTLSVNENHDIEKILQSTDELSMITYHLTHIAKVSKSLSKQKSPLSLTAQREFDELWERIALILRTLEDAFLKSNSITSMWMLRQHTIVQEHIKDTKKNHIKRLRCGTCHVETGMYFLDLLNDCEQISSHCTALFQEAYIMDHLEERKG